MTPDPTHITIRGTVSTSASQMADTIAQLQLDVERRTQQLDEALDQRDDARETACRFEAEIALMKPVVDAAVAWRIVFGVGVGLSSHLDRALESRVTEFIAATAETGAS